MKIILQEEKEYTISSIEPGTAFYYECNYYIKINLDNPGIGDGWNSVNLNTGNAVFIPTHKKVHLVNAKIVVGT